MSEKIFFQGFIRNDGRVGVRNHLLIIPSVFCANRVAELIAANVTGAIAIPHQHGCAIIGKDKEMIERTLVGFGTNPNVGAVIVVGLGCETVSAKILGEKIAASGKPVRVFIIQEEGGTLKAVEHAVAAALEMQAELSLQERKKVSVKKLILGTECGGSDAFSGLTANPSVGRTCDLLVEAGGTVILSETTEFIGAEHLLAQRAVNKKTGQKILKIVQDVEDRARDQGVDIRGGQPTPGNIEGGLTTIEEKSLGCIYKGGTTKVTDVYEYAQQVKGHGLVIVDTPGQDVESVTGMAAAGASVILFTTGRGTPTGCPIVPVIKIASNTEAFSNMPDNIDINAGLIAEGSATVEEIGQLIFDETIKVCSGKKPKAEILGHREFGIYKIGATL